MYQESRPLILEQRTRACFNGLVHSFIGRDRNNNRSVSILGVTGL